MKYSVHSILQAAKMLSKRIENPKEEEFTDVQIALHEAGISLIRLQVLVSELSMIDANQDR